MVVVSRQRRKCVSQLGMLDCSVTHPSADIKPLVKVLSEDRKHTNGMNGQRTRVKVEIQRSPVTWRLITVRG